VRATLDLERGFLARSGRAEGGRRIAPEAPAGSAAPGRLRRLWAALTGWRGT
jgi:hypothetical protein